MLLTNLSQTDHVGKRSCLHCRVYDYNTRGNLASTNRLRASKIFPAPQTIIRMHLSSNPGRTTRHFFLPVFVLANLGIGFLVIAFDIVTHIGIV